MRGTIPVGPGRAERRDDAHDLARDDAELARELAAEDEAGKLDAPAALRPAAASRRADGELVERADLQLALEVDDRAGRPSDRCRARRRRRRFGPTASIACP
jgi:hypothetical protein